MREKLTHTKHRAAEKISCGFISQQYNIVIMLAASLSLLFLLYTSTCWGFSGIPITRQLDVVYPKGLAAVSSTSKTQPDEDMLNEILEVAIEASKRAGDIILQHKEGADVVELKSTSRDLLTLVDPLCEEAIRETILAKFPDHDFLGEEQVAAGKEAAIAALEDKLQHPTSPWLYICDPIDGTTNFSNGIPICMPSIAVAYQGEVVIGVLYDPHQDELFTAIRGKGAYLNEQRIYVGEQDKLGDATVGMESPAGEESLQQCVRATRPLMPSVRTLRMLGSSAVMLPWVANGRLTAYWTPDECAWDIAAGALIVQEAGGKVTDLEGNDYTLRTRGLVTSNGKVHDELLEILQASLL